MVILPSTNTRDASKGIQMHFLETQLILWHHGNNIHVEKAADVKCHLNWFFTSVHLKSNSYQTKSQK